MPCLISTGRVPTKHSLSDRNRTIDRRCTPEGTTTLPLESPYLLRAPLRSSSACARAMIHPSITCARPGDQRSLRSTWGTTRCLIPAQTRQGPAGAGSRGSPRRAPSPPRDHPRGCGEQAPENAEDGAISGPSLRVRGAGRGTRPRRHRPGAIPAVRGADSLTCMSAWQQVHHETLSRSPAFQVYGLCDLTTNAPRPSIPFLSTGTVVSTASYRFLAIASNDRK